ncbi:MAG: hypothetical protein H0T42_00630, partial [Deltaproteobacteria bacterium]|nr:hypothetical protein [Deltaproteobacteria bacterium]
MALVVVSAGLGLAVPRSAHAQVTDGVTCPVSPPACTPSTTGCCTRDFVGSSSQKAIVIPMDRCHQNPTRPGDVVATTTSAPTWCSNPVANGDGMNRAYGLVYRLMQYGVPVYWVVNPTKAPGQNTSVSDTWTEKDVDFWILSNGANPPSSGSPLPAIPALQSAPVRKLTSAASSPFTLSGTAGSYSMGAFPVRGGAFVIAAADRPAFDAFWATRIGSGRNCGTSGLDCLDFRAVTMWEVNETAHFSWQDFTKAKVSGAYVKNDNQLPVSMKVDYAPPRIALIDGNLLKNWLATANLDDTESGACVNGTFTYRNTVACVMSEANVQADLLKATHADGGSFTWAWFDIGASSSCATTLTKIKEFATAVPGIYSAGNIMFASSGIKLAEECAAQKGTLGLAGTGLSLNTSGINETATKTLIFRYPTNLFSQYGDLPPDFAAGSPASFDRVSGSTDLYSSTFLTAPNTLRRLLTAERNSSVNCTNHKDTGTNGATSPAGCDDTGTSTSADITDLYVYGRYLNDVDNGIAFYSPGNNITPGGQQAQLKLVLSAILATPTLRKEQAPIKREISRSNPITAAIGGEAAIVQGSFEYTYVTYPDPISTLAYPANLKQYPVPRTVSGVYNTADVDAFTFPAQRGHMRARKASTITTTANAFDASPTNVLFDAATAIPPATLTGCTLDFKGTCRSVWTTTTAPTSGRTSKPARVMLKTADTTNRATLKALVLPNDTTSTFTDAHYDTVISRVLAGVDDGSGTFSPGLGGVDRSTVAVIPASTVARPAAPFTGQRPTVAYFGATDGMLHAVCASVDATKGCDVLGRELWAYVPRSNLKNLRYNTARVDGSPRVLDVRGNWNNNGIYFWKTVLIFQTGTGSSSSADATPAVIALDVTNPQDPQVLWERTSSSTPGTYDLGVGLTIASGAATIGTTTKNVTILVTNNGGTAGSALVVTAVNTDDGTDLWGVSNNPDGIPANQDTRFAYKYTTEAGHTAANGLPPPSGVPGGATSVDKSLVGLNGFMTDIVVTDLYGSVWVLDPATGRSRYTTNATITGADIPMFQFSTDFHPIGAKAALYGFGSTQYVVFTDGGYVDTTGTVTWGCVMVALQCTYPTQHYLMAVSLAYPVTSTTRLNESSGSTYIPIKVPLGSGERGWSQAYVVNDQIFVTTETSDVNLGTYGTNATSTGKMYNVA